MLLPNKEEWKSVRPFALLLRKDNNLYQRIGLVEFFKESEVEKLQGELKKIIIGVKQQVQIQIPPK